jgi:hypothetical protein
VWAQAYQEQLDQRREQLVEKLRAMLPEALTSALELAKKLMQGYHIHLELRREAIERTFDSPGGLSEALEQRFQLLNIKERLAQISEQDAIVLAYACSPATTRAVAKPKKKINILSLDGTQGDKYQPPLVHLALLLTTAITNVIDGKQEEA